MTPPADGGARKNTDRELWREREDDYYADSIHVTAHGGIGINCGGRVFVMPIRQWHALAEALSAPAAIPAASGWQDDIRVGEVVVLGGGRRVQVCGDAHGTPYRNHRGNIAVRNLKTNRLSYVQAYHIREGRADGSGVPHDE